MKTFSEAVQIKNNVRLFEQLLIELERKGVSSIEVVDWLVFDDQLNLHEGIGDWFRQGINNLASGNVNYSNIANQAQTGGGLAGNVAGGTIGAGLAGLGGFARGALGSAASNIARGFGAGFGTKDGTHKTSAGQVGGSPGAPGTGAPPQVQQALANLDSYSKRTAGRVQKILGDPSFGAAITQLLNMMRDPENFTNAQPSGTTMARSVSTPGRVATTRPAIESHDVRNLNNLTSLIENTNSFYVYLEQKSLVEKVINEFAVREIDPAPFIEWYIEEGHELDLEQFNENLWDRFTGWLGQKTGWTAAQNKRDLQLTNYLLTNLQNLQKQEVGNKNLNDQLNIVIQNLQKAVPVLGGNDANAGDGAGSNAGDGAGSNAGDGAGSNAGDGAGSNAGDGAGSNAGDGADKNLDPIALQHIKQLQNLMNNASDLQDPKNKADAKAMIADIKKRFPAFDPASYSIDPNKFEWLYRELLQDQLFEEDRKFFESIYGSKKKLNWFAF